MPASRMLVRAPQLNHQTDCDVNFAFPSHPPSLLLPPTRPLSSSSSLTLPAFPNFSPFLPFLISSVHPASHLLRSSSSVCYLVASPPPPPSSHPVLTPPFLPWVGSVLLSLPVDPRAPRGPVGPPRHHGRRSGFVCPH